MENTTSKFGDIAKKILKFILFFGIGAFFIWLSVRKLSPDDVENLKESAAQVTRGSAWVFLFLAFLVAAISNYIRALRNRQLLQPLGYETRTSMVFYSVMVMYLANYAFPRLGEVLRCTFLQRYERVPFEKSLGTVVTERAVDLICLILVFLSAFVINTGLLDSIKVGDVTLRESLSAKFSAMTHNYTMFILIGALAVFILIAVLTKKWWSKITFFVKIKNFFVGIWQGLVSIKDVKSPALFLIYTVSIWILWILRRCSASRPLISCREWALW